MIIKFLKPSSRIILPLMTLLFVSHGYSPTVVDSLQQGGSPITAQNRTCKEIGSLNTNVVWCSNWHVYMLFLLDPNTRHDALLPFVTSLQDILYSCERQDSLRESAVPNRFTYISVHNTWSCNVTECNFSDNLSLDNSKYPPSLDVDLFGLVRQAVKYAQKDVHVDNNATAFFVISNIAQESLYRYQNFTYILNNQQEAGGLLATYRVPVRFLWFTGADGDVFLELKTYSKGWFDYYIFRKASEFISSIGDLYICPVNGSYVLPTVPTISTTTTTPVGKKRGGGLKPSEWIPICVLSVLLISIIAFLVLRCICCPAWNPWLLLHDAIISLKRRDTQSSRGESISRLWRAETLGAISDLNQFSITLSREPSKGATIAKDDWDVSQDEVFVCDDKLGQGNFSEVRKGILKSFPPAVTKRMLQNGISLHGTKGHDFVAVKCLRTSTFTDARQGFLHEMRIMKRIGQHHCIISLMGCVREEIGKELLLTEYCSHGDLHTFLRRTQKTLRALTCNERKRIVWQICEALVFLTANGYIHRDVAARNVFLADRQLAKLGDFGLCVHNPDKGVKRCGGRLPLRYIPPEAHSNMEFSEKSDVWSFGLLIYETYSNGSVPYTKVPVDQLLERITKGERPKKPDDCPDRLFELACICWSFEPSARPTFTQIRTSLFSILDQNSDQYGYINFYSRKQSVNYSLSSLDTNSADE